MSSTSGAEVAWFTAKKWLRMRKFWALASPIANAVVGVQGSGTPTSELNTGPQRVEYSVRLTSSSEPSGCLDCTVTVRLVIASGLPSTRYVVGDPGTRVSW